MPFSLPPTITISKEDGKLIVIRKRINIFKNIMLVIYDILRLRKVAYSPSDKDEVLTFGADGFVLQSGGMTLPFSYSHDVRPRLRQSPGEEGYMDLIIPYSMLAGQIPSNGQGTLEITLLKIADARQILAALKEHLDAI